MKLKRVEPAEGTEETGYPSYSGYRSNRRTFLKGVVVGAGALVTGTTLTGCYEDTATAGVPPATLRGSIKSVEPPPSGGTTSPDDKTDQSPPRTAGVPRPVNAESRPAVPGGAPPPHPPGEPVAPRPKGAPPLNPVGPTTSSTSCTGSTTSWMGVDADAAGMPVEEVIRLRGRVASPAPPVPTPPKRPVRLGGKPLMPRPPQGE